MKAGRRHGGIPAETRAARDVLDVSLAGGAFLHWLSGKPLPGVEVLREAKTKVWNDHHSLRALGWA